MFSIVPIRGWARRYALPYVANLTLLGDLEVAMVLE